MLGLAVIAAIGAGVSYAPALLSPTAAASKRVPIDFRALIEKVQVSLKQGESTDREERVLASATTKWLRDPLRERPLLVEERREPLAPPPEYVAPLPKYVGFINIGDQLIAIIDGQDYRPGEAIEGGEFQLSQIHPNHIELLRRGAIDPVNVPLEKAQTTGEPQTTGESQ